MQNQDFKHTDLKDISAIVRSMYMFLIITLEHIFEVIMVDGWVKLHALVVWRLVTSAVTIQQGQKHQAVNSIKIKRRLMLKRSKCRWTRHGRREKIATHQVQMRSLHPMDQVITSPPTRQSKGMCGTNISKLYYASIPRI